MQRHYGSDSVEALFQGLGKLGARAAPCCPASPSCQCLALWLTCRLLPYLLLQSGWHAKWTLATVPYVSSGSAVWDLSQADQVTDAVLYPEVCVICEFADGTTDYCECRIGAGCVTCIGALPSRAGHSLAGLV